MAGKADFEVKILEIMGKLFYLDGIRWENCSKMGFWVVYNGW